MPHDRSARCEPACLPSWVVCTQTYLAKVIDDMIGPSDNADPEVQSAVPWLTACAAGVPGTADMYTYT